MADSITLPISCPECGGALQAEVTEAEATSTPFSWECPYCHIEFETDFGGPVKWIVEASASKHSTH